VVCDDVALPSDGSGSARRGAPREQRAPLHRAYARLAGYPRLRVGTRPADDRAVGDLVEFVLAPFDDVERREVVELFPRLADACETWLRDGVVAAMNKHNGQAQGKP
jgi:PTH1 family peptidyl-tRNA hydrolase